MSAPVLVTGCASGIGRAVAEELLRAGRDVIGLDRDAAAERGAHGAAGAAGRGAHGAAGAAERGAHGAAGAAGRGAHGAAGGAGRGAHAVAGGGERAVREAPPIEVVACDLADPDAIDRALAALPATLGGIASVAGVPGTLPPATVLRVNLLAPRRLALGLEDRLEAGGALVAVSSVAAGRCALPQPDVDALLEAGDDDALAWLADEDLDGSATYDLSKRALNQLALGLAARWLARGVRSLTVSPGPTQTPILADFEQTMGADRMAAALGVVGRHGRPEDIAPVVAFALDATRAGWCNAVDIRVDGGLVGARSVAALVGHTNKER